MPAIRAASKEGFTLVELLIALVVSAVVVTAALGLLDTQRQADRTTKVRTGVQLNARYALDMITRDLMEAGQGMDPNAVFGVVATSSGGGTASDTLYSLFADPDTPIHGLTAPPDGKEKKVITVKISCGDEVADIAVGDLVYLASGSARGVARVNTVTRNENGDKCGNDPNKNLGTVSLSVTAVDGEGHGWVLQGNEVGAALLRVNAAVYFVDNSNPARPTLARATKWDGSWSPVPIAHGVSDFQVELQFSDGTKGTQANGNDTNSDNDYDDIDTINVKVTAFARRKDKDIKGGELFESVYALSVSPRNQLYTRNRN